MCLGYRSNKQCVKALKVFDALFVVDWTNSFFDWTNSLLIGQIRLLSGRIRLLIGRKRTVDWTNLFKALQIFLKARLSSACKKTFKVVTTVLFLTLKRDHPWYVAMSKFQRALCQTNNLSLRLCWRQYGDKTEIWNDYPFYSVKNDMCHFHGYTWFWKWQWLSRLSQIRFEGTSCSIVSQRRVWQITVLSAKIC